MNWIAKAYQWFWKDFLMRTEPFTYQFRRMAEKYPWVWVIGLALLVIAFAGWIIFRCATSKWFWFITLSLMTVFLFWLSLHLGGYC